MIAARLTITGVDEIARAIEEGGKAAVDKVKAALALKGDEVLSLARPLVPVEPGDGGQLQASLRRTRPSYYASKGLLTCSVVAGGAEVLPFLSETHHRYNIYAVLQEFDIGKGAPFRHTSGQAHFLTRPLEQVADSVPDALLDAVNAPSLVGA
jgi:hypothetical protein